MYRTKLKHVHNANAAYVPGLFSQVEALHLILQFKQSDSHCGGSCWDSHVPDRVWLVRKDYFAPYMAYAWMFRYT